MHVISTNARGIRAVIEFAGLILLGGSYSSGFSAATVPPGGSASLPGRTEPGPTALLRERPWVGVVYFYWYTWDYNQQLGGWMGGIHNTPLYGYYDSRTYRDNYRSLQLASEWGVTHHWMDYWAPDWKDDQGQMREKAVVRAAEDLRKAGYNIWMSYYQDGQNFEMKDFAKNVTEKRDVHQWLRDFARSPVWPRVQGKPQQLVYARNGSPKLTTDHAGFREFLKGQYGSIDRLNEDWGTHWTGFDAIEMDLSARGPHRAWSAKYQHEIWRRAWGELEKAIRQEFGLPGMVASFDVGYGPYANLGYAEFLRTFGGPHSYAGIFGPPHDQDAERFIQVNIAKAYDTVFLDHYKNFYHDWDIRVPGFAFLPDPHHFDRFWVGNLMRYAEAVLHLSWNEWWEGSNLEPCMEWGKTYCEKQLLYSTIMQWCYESIRHWNKGARIALLLNDYHNLASSLHPREVTDTLQALRRLNGDFDLLTDDFVTTEKLKNYRVVIAPAAGVGFGYNAEGKRIAPILAEWVRGAPDRRLIVSADEAIRRVLDLKPTAPTSVAATSRPGDDLNVFIDVGTKGDDHYVIGGATHRETWAPLAPGEFTPGKEHTLRWTPGLGKTTTLYLPFSPHRDHVLRLAGPAIWPSVARVRLDGQEIGRLEITPGRNEYALPIPASTVGERNFAMIDLLYEPLHVPKDKDPKTYPTEGRYCNLAMDWVQIATSNVPPRTTTQRYKAPGTKVRFASELLGELKGKTFDVPSRPHARSLGKVRFLSIYEDGSPRDAVVPHGQGQVLYVNGLFNDVREDAYWRSILSNWAGTPPAELVRGRTSAGAHIHTEHTDFLLAYNYDPSAPDRIRCRLPARSWPVSEAVALSRDGTTYQPLQIRRNGSWIEWDDTLGYYAVYQLAFAPVRVETGAIAASLGQTTQVPAKVTNIGPQLVNVALTFRSVIPTVTGQTVEVGLWPGQTQSVLLPIHVAPTADWGRKTAVIEVQVDRGQKAYLWREVVVLRPPELKLTRHVTSTDRAQIEVMNTACPFGDAAPAMEASATLGTRSFQLGQVPPGGRVTKEVVAAVPLSGPSTAESPETADLAALRSCKVALTWMDDRHRMQGQDELWIARPAAAAKQYPGAVAVVSAFNHYARPFDRQLVELALPSSLVQAGSYHLRDGNGTAWPAEMLDGGRLLFPVSVGPRGAIGFTLVRGASPAGSTDLTVGDQRASDGTLTVSNAFYAVTLSQADGGTVTHLISKRTGKDYGLKSFDVNYGRFSHYDPNKPAVDSVAYINESKTVLANRRCEWKRVEVGPLRAVVAAEVGDENVRCRTTYEFRAHTPYFRVHRQLEFVGKQVPQEIVVIDGRFRRNALSKSFPNFVGEVNNAAQPHFGWRYGHWVPDYLTLMTPPGFEESLSFIVLRKEGLDQVRQGFWPAERPKSGPCEQARIELIAQHATVCDVEFVVYLHREHQVAAARLLEELHDPPLATLTMEPLWR